MNYPLIKPNYYRRLVKDLFGFIKNPENRVQTEKATKNKVYDTIGLFFIKLAFSLTVAGIPGAFYEPKNLTSASMSERFTPLVFLLVGGIILPLFEEIAFRLSLKFKPVYLALTLGAITYYILTRAVFQTRLSLVDESFAYRIFAFVGVVILSFLILGRPKLRETFARFWEKNFRWIYYFSFISFAWLHIFNFELNVTNLLLLPILTLPQLFSGTIAGYTRIAFGFRYPLIIHMLTNLIFISLSFLPD